MLKMIDLQSHFDQIVQDIDIQPGNEDTTSGSGDACSDSTNGSWTVKETCRIVRSIGNGSNHFRIKTVRKLNGIASELFNGLCVTFVGTDTEVSAPITYICMETSVVMLQWKCDQQQILSLSLWASQILPKDAVMSIAKRGPCRSIESIS